MSDHEPSPTIRSLASREANKDARAGLQSARGFRLAQLPDSRWALCEMTMNFYVILEAPPTTEQLLAYRAAFDQALTTTAEARFFGEPSDKDWGRDQRMGRKTVHVPRQRAVVEGLDL